MQDQFSTPTFLFFLENSRFIVFSEVSGIFQTFALKIRPNDVKLSQIEIFLVIAFEQGMNGRK